MGRGEASEEGRGEASEEGRGEASDDGSGETTEDARGEISDGDADDVSRPGVPGPLLLPGSRGWSRHPSRILWVNMCCFIFPWGEDLSQHGFVGHIAPPLGQLVTKLFFA